MEKKFCIYIRVSTKKQGVSGLGLEAQREICMRYISEQNGECAAEFQDVESGKNRNRQGLWEAIEFCKKTKAELVIAKLDRLARDVEFTFQVINTKIAIHFCDMPVVNTMILGVFASVAQYERELISQRTKAALAAKKTRLGRDKCCDTSKARSIAAQVKRESAVNNPSNKIVWALLTEKSNEPPTKEECMRLSSKLNDMGVKTSTGLDFTPLRLRAAYNNLKKLYA